MAIKDTLLSLFGWKSSSPPRDKPSKGDSPHDYQYGDNPYQLYTNMIRRPYSRRRKYDIYDEMDEMELVSSILDAYAEDATQYDREKKASIWIEASSSKVKKVLNDLKDRLDWEELVEPITRDVGKFGDDFAVLDIEKTDDGKEQIASWDWTDPRSIERIENKQGTLIGFENTARLKEVMAGIERGETPRYTYKPWDIVHFRLYRRKREYKQKYRNIYGTSLLAGSERITKQLKIIEDMLVVRRLTKSLDTRIYKVDTARSSVEEEIQILKRWRNALKRKAYVDPANQRYDAPFDPFTWQEDLFWPQRADSQSTVDVIQGQGDVADIVDVEYFLNKFFGSLRAPKGYFGFEGDIEAKATLSAQDMKWGRAVNALQRAVKNGFVRLCQIELALHGLDPFSKFTIGMVVPSVLEDLSRLEAVQTLIDVAERLASLGETMNLDEKEWKIHILRSVMGMSDDEIDRFAGSLAGEPDDQPMEPDPNAPDKKPPPSGDEPDDEPEDERRAINEVVQALLAQKLRFTKPGTDPNERSRPEELPNYSGDVADSLAHINVDEDEDARSGDDKPSA